MGNKLPVTVGAQITCLIGKLTDFRIGVRPKHYLSVTVRAQIAFDVSHTNMMNSMQGTVVAQIAITMMGLSCFVTETQQNYHYQPELKLRQQLSS